MTTEELLPLLSDNQRRALAAVFVETKVRQIEAKRKAVAEADERRRIAAREAAALKKAAAIEAEATRKAKVAAGWKRAVATVNGKNTPVSMPPSAIDRAAADVRAQRCDALEGGR